MDRQAVGRDVGRSGGERVLAIEARIRMGTVATAAKSCEEAKSGALGFSSQRHASMAPVFAEVWVFSAYA